VFMDEPHIAYSCIAEIMGLCVVEVTTERQNHFSVVKIKESEQRK
jgi:hypothetical protein